MKKQMHLVFETRDCMSDKKLSTTVLMTGTEKACRKELFRLFNLDNQIGVPKELSRVWGRRNEEGVPVDRCWKIVRYVQ